MSDVKFYDFKKPDRDTGFRLRYGKKRQGMATLFKARNGRMAIKLEKDLKHSVMKNISSYNSDFRTLITRIYKIP
jgi:hypothetical protein